MPIVASLLLLSLVPVLRGLRKTARGTTLLAAWNWLAIAWLAWLFAWIAPLMEFAVSIQDQIWYAAALLGLCPPIAVLGAKRPGSRVWTVFVVIPLVLVFAWPALTGWVRQVPPARLQLETPVLFGFCLVLIMGYGNYLGTGHSLSALLTVVGLGALAFSLGNSPQPEQSIQPIFSTIAIVVAGHVCWLRKSRPPETTAGWDRVWWEFQESFGIVWAKRAMDRINHSAQTENWPAHWDIEGLVWHPDASTEQKVETRHRIDHTLRWLLRRFVDSEWIEQRLNEPARRGA